MQHKESAARPPLADCSWMQASLLQKWLHTCQGWDHGRPVRSGWKQPKVHKVLSLHRLGCGERGEGVEQVVLGGKRIAGQRLQWAATRTRGSYSRFTRCSVAVMSACRVCAGHSGEGGGFSRGAVMQLGACGMSVVE